MRWLDAVGAALLTTVPGSNQRLGRLHQRLTVARAGAPERGVLSEVVDGTVLGPVELASAAEEMALERSAQRAAERARLDAATDRVAYDLGIATDRLEQVRSSRQALVDGADWAERVDSELEAHAASVAAARLVVEARHHDQRDARAGLDRVLEQRSAAAAAMEDADRELAELAGVTMDESGLRRELEAAGQAVREAHEAHAAAVLQVQQLMAERDNLERQAAELREALAAVAPDGQHSDEDFDRVLGALDGWLRATEQAGLDSYAQALADAFRDLSADLAELEDRIGTRPDPEALRRAQDDVDRAAAALQELDALGVAPALTVEDRAAIDAAHEAVQQAEERIGHRVGRAGAQRRLDEAVAAEAAILERFGFTSHLQVVLTGGRRPSGTPARFEAEKAYVAAKAAREHLERAQRRTPELDHLYSEAARLHAHAVDRLGVQPGSAVIDLLRVHPVVPGHIVHALRDALASVGVRPVGVSLPDAAQEWLQDRAAAAEDRRRRRDSARDLDADLEAILIRAAGLAVELAEARRIEERSAEDLESASRSVGAVEAELTVRAGEDDTRLKRFVAAEQLRTQIGALTATLSRAEQDAQAMFDRACEATAAAELAFDRVQGVIDGHARRARQLASELEEDHRPTGEPLAELVRLAVRLREREESMQREVDEASADVAAVSARVDEARAAAEAAGTGLEGPRPEDVVDGLRAFLVSHGQGLIVLDDPFVEVDTTLRPELLDVLLGHDGPGPLVLLTDDASLLGWAIELPGDVADVTSTDSVLNLCARTADTNEVQQQPATDLDANPATPAPVRAGHR